MSKTSLDYYQLDALATDCGLAPVPYFCIYKGTAAARKNFRARLEQLGIACQPGREHLLQTGVMNVCFMTCDELGVPSNTCVAIFRSN